MRIPVRRRLPFIVAAFALSVLSCGRELTGPENGIYRNRVAMLAFAPEFSGPMAVIEGAGDAVPFEKVRVVLRGLDGSIVKDTMVAFPSDADEISLALSIAIPQNSPAAGLPLTVTMAYVNAAGDTVFRGGPNPVVARPVGSPGADTPVTVPVTYDGAGKDATRVAISPKTGTAVAGQTLAFSATAFDAADAAIPNTPVGAGGSLVADSGHVLRLANGSFTTLQVGDSVGTRLGSLRVEANTTVSLLADGVRFAGDVTIDGLESAVEPNGIVWAEIGGQLRDAVGSRFTANAILTGTDAIATPRFAGSMLDVRGTNTLVDSLNAQRLTVGSGGNLIINGQRVGVDSLYTAGSGILTMANPADVVTVLGTAIFSGGPSILTDGRLRLAGRVDGNGVAFQGAPTHTTEFFGSAVQQVGFGQRGFGATEAHFGSVELAKSGGAPFSSTDLYINGQLITAAPAQRWSGTGASQPLYVRGANISYLELPNQPLIIVDGADVTRLDSLRFTSFDSAATQLSIARGGGIVPVNSPAFDSTAADAVYLRVDDVLAGADILTIQVSNARPFLHDGRVTQGGGALILGWSDFAEIVWVGAVDSDWQNPGNWQQGRAPTATDAVVVPSEFINFPSIGSDVTVGSLQWQPSGTMTLAYNLTVGSRISGGGQAPALACSSGGRITFAPADSAIASGHVACPVYVSNGRVVVSSGFTVDTLTVAGDAEVQVRESNQLNVNGNLVVVENATLRMEGSSETTVQVYGSATFGSTPAAGALAGGTLLIGGDFTQQTAPTAFAPSATHTTRFVGSGPQRIAFAHPDSIAGSRFGRVAVEQAGAGTSVLLQSDVFATGELVVQSGSVASIGGDGGTRRLHVRGVQNNSDSGVEFSDVGLEIANGGTLDSQLYGFRFVNFAAAGEPQLRIARDGALVTLNSFQFDGTAPSPLYLQVEDTDSLGQTMTAISLLGTTPGFHGGAIETLGGASITGWEMAPLFVWTGAVDQDFGNPGNWSSLAVPDATSNVLVPAGPLVGPTLSEPIAIKSLVVEVGALALEADDWNITIADSLVTAPGVIGVWCYGTSTLEFASSDTASIRGEVGCPVRVSSGALVTRGASRLGGNVVLTGSGTFVPRHDVTIGGEVGSLLVESGARLLMQTPGIVVAVQGPTTFSASATSLLEHGELRARDGVTQGGSPTALSALASHRLTITGTDATVSIAHPQDVTLGAVEIDAGIPAHFLSSVRMAGGLSLLSGASLSLAGETSVQVGGSLLAATAGLSCGSQSSISLLNAGQSTASIAGDVSGCPLTVRGGSYQLAGNDTVRTASLTIAGDGSLDVAGRRLLVNDSLVTEEAGVLRMVSAEDNVTVLGDATFRGGSTTGMLTNGVLRLHGALRQFKGKAEDTFHGSGAHTVLFAGGITNQLFFESSDGAAASRIGVLRVQKLDGAVSLASGNLYAENIAGVFVGASVLLGQPSGTAHLYVLETVDSAVSTEGQGFGLGQFGFVTVVKGLGTGCALASMRLVGSSYQNLLPSECGYVP